MLDASIPNCVVLPPHASTRHAPSKDPMAANVLALPYTAASVSARWQDLTDNGGQLPYTVARPDSNGGQRLDATALLPSASVSVLQYSLLPTPPFSI